MRKFFCEPLYNNLQSGEKNRKIGRQRKNRKQNMCQVCCQLCKQRDGGGGIDLCLCKINSRGHTHTQGHTTLEALAVFRQGESGGLENRDFSLFILNILKYVNSKG